MNGGRNRSPMRSETYLQTLIVGTSERLTGGTNSNAKPCWHTNLVFHRVCLVRIVLYYDLRDTEPVATVQKEVVYLKLSPQFTTGFSLESLCKV